MATNEFAFLVENASGVWQSVTIAPVADAHLAFGHTAPYTPVAMPLPVVGDADKPLVLGHTTPFTPVAMTPQTVTNVTLTVDPATPTRNEIAAIATRVEAIQTALENLKILTH